MLKCGVCFARKLPSFYLEPLSHRPPKFEKISEEEQRELVHITLAQVPDAVTTYQGYAVCEVHLLEKVRPAQ